MRGKLLEWLQAARKYMNTTPQRVPQLLDYPVICALLLVVFALMVLTFLHRWYDGWDGLWQGVFVEGTGATMDLVVFGILMALIAGRRERNRDIKSQEDLIDDFKKWDTDEARYRIAGAVRRLNRLGRTAIDFTGIEMSNFSFRRHDINSIVGSKYYDGTWGSLGSRDKMVLDAVDFSQVDCRDVVFSAFNPLGWLSLPLRPAILRDCWFAGAKLEGSKFRGSRIEWSEEPPGETGHWDKTREGEPTFIPTYSPPFEQVNLAGVSFEDVEFRNADFRDVDNLRECNFAGATGLEDALFDSDEDKEWALQTARTTR